METPIQVKFISLHRYASLEDNAILWTASRYAQPAEGFLHYPVSGPRFPTEERNESGI
jgi:hypothetical protein